MNKLSDYVGRCSHALEQCLLSENPQAKISELPEGYERKFLTFLLQPYTKDFAKELKSKFKITDLLAQKLIDWKVKKKLFEAKDVEEIKSLVDDFVSKNESEFSYQKPVEFKNSQKEKENKVNIYPSVLPNEAPLHEQTVEKLASNNDNQFRFITEVALRTLSPEELKGLKLEWR